MASDKKQDDPLEKLAKLIDDKITEAFDSRDRRAKEADDPWARLEGVVDRTVSKRLAELREGREEGEPKERGGKRPKVVKDDEDGGFLGLGLG